jgi:hypothetical protein
MRTNKQTKQNYWKQNKTIYKHAQLGHAFSEKNKIRNHHWTWNYKTIYKHAWKELYIELN